MQHKSSSIWLNWKGPLLIAIIGALFFFLATEHRAHFFGALPWLIFLACPIMHLLMHRGHGADGGHKH